MAIIWFPKLGVPQISPNHHPFLSISNGIFHQKPAGDYGQADLHEAGQEGPGSSLLRSVAATLRRLHEIPVPKEMEARTVMGVKSSAETNSYGIDGPFIDLLEKFADFQ
jgi:hypothetical protein